VLSLQDSLWSSTHKGLGDVIAKSYALSATSYRCTNKSQIFFWFTSDAFWKRHISSFQDSYVNVYEEIYEQRWYWNRLPVAFLEESHEEFFKRLCKQTPL
jgi:hypothetical protein